MVGGGLRPGFQDPDALGTEAVGVRGSDEAQREARVYALLAVQQVLRNGLAVLGASAPESM